MDDSPTVHPLRTIPTLTGVVDVSAGTTVTCAVRSNGDLYCWGRSDQGALGLGANVGQSISGTSERYVATPTRLEGLPPAIDVETAWGTTCARFSTGQVKCWGLNDSGQVGDSTKIQRSSPVDVVGLP
jgi:alpha-tubulin suppressor-like RCC1 family protein